MNISSRALSSNRSLLATAILVFIILLPGAAVSQQVVTCPGLPGHFVILRNQPYALCAGAAAVNFNEITYANCARLRGNSISLQQNFPSAPGNDDNPGNIATVNEGAPNRGGYIVSTYSAPAGAVDPNGNLAVYSCDRGGSSAQCDGGLCFTSTTGKNPPLWGPVSNSQIVCSCPIRTTAVPFSVIGPKPCPATAAEYDAVCGANGSQANNGATIFIGDPIPNPDSWEILASCVGQPVTMNTCTRPAH